MARKYTYGWVKDKKDERDWLYKSVHAPTSPIDINANTDLRGLFKDLPYDQGQLGSCTANSSTGAYTFVHPGGPYSRLELYYQSRLLEGDVSQDNGAQLRDVMKVLATVGIGLERDWPYIVSKFADPPPPIEMTEAAQDKIITYSRLQGREDYRTCLAQGFPFVMGFLVFESFESQAVAQNGIVPVPNFSTEQMVGGHAVLVCGFQTNFRGSGVDMYIVRNSWGTAWGDKGFFYIPVAYMENSIYGCSDSWTIRK